LTGIAKRAVDRGEGRCQPGQFEPTAVRVLGRDRGHPPEPVQEPSQPSPQAPVQAWEDDPAPNTSSAPIPSGDRTDPRPDVKPFFVSMVWGARRGPIFGAFAEGHASDKSLNNEMLTAMATPLATFGLAHGAWIAMADSALMTEEQLKTRGDDRLCIRRLPANANEWQRVIREAVAGANDAPAH